MARVIDVLSTKKHYKQHWPCKLQCIIKLKYKNPKQLFHKTCKLFTKKIDNNKKSKWIKIDFFVACIDYKWAMKANYLNKINWQ